MRRIFQPDGRALIVAMDHAAPMGPIPGLVDPEATIERVVAAGADAILTTYGTANRFVRAFDGKGLILRLIQGESLGVEEALRCGADAVLSMYFVGEEDRLTIRHTGELSAACQTWGMPLGAEVLSVAAGAEPGELPWLLAKGSRGAFELGADFIKTMYTGDQESFARIVEGCHVPVVVLGGERTSSDADLLTAVRAALDAGAAGVAIGRNIWQHAEPEAMVRALASLVHDGSSVEQAQRALPGG